jgi:hypothetical protein
MTIKSIGFAYATSTFATRLGAGDTGCYYVETKADEISHRALTLEGPFASLEDAERVAAANPAAWSRYTRRAA